MAADLILHSPTDLAAAVQAVALDAKSENTKRAYYGAYRRYKSWLESNGYVSSAEYLAGYMVALAGNGASMSTLHVARAACLYMDPHIDARHPMLADTVAGLERRLSVAPKGGKDALVTSFITATVAEIPTGIVGSRDRAIILLGFAGAYRRSELCAISLADMKFEEQGIRIITRKSKSDQRGVGYEKAIPRASDPVVCAVAAVESWILWSGIESGPLFRRIDRHGHIGGHALTPGAVAVIVKERCESAGIDASNIAAHSLRSGWVTSAAEAGKSLDQIMLHSGHKSVNVVRGYIQHADLFKNHAGSGLL